MVYLGQILIIYPMRPLLLIVACAALISCQRSSNLTSRQRLDSIKVGMTMQEVMEIYGMQDTINRSSKSGECGFIEDSITGELVPGKDGVSPLLTVIMSDSTTLFFSYGKLMMKPEMTWEEQQADTMLMRILNSEPDMDTLQVD